MRAPILAVPLLAVASCSPGPGPARTNVVLIVIDTLRADALDGAHTPAIDRLAADGVVFSSAFSHAPLTLPSHTALFSSTHPSQSGVTSNGQAVPPELTLFPEWMADRGWRPRAMTSLATLWPPASGAGLDRGFETYGRGEHEVLEGQLVNAAIAPLVEGESADRGLLLFAHYSEPHQPYDAHGTADSEARILHRGELVGRVAMSGSAWWERELRLPPGRHDFRIESSTTFRVRAVSVECGGRAVPTTGDVGPDVGPLRDFEFAVANDADETRDYRVRLWIHDTPPIDEIRRRYALEVEAADRAIGELLDTLRARDLYDSSLIVLTSDHGEGLGEHATVGHCRHLYDELLRVPLVIKPPAGHSATRALEASRDSLVRHVDIVPTLCDILELPAFPGAEGVSLLTRAPRVLAAEAHPPEAPDSIYALRDGAHKLVFRAGAGRFELYSLLDDPGELEDVFASRGDRFVEWQARLRELASVRDGRPPERPRDETAAWLRSLGYASLEPE